MTHDQHIASDPGISAWVSASAGTGKTKVLTDRVLRLLLDGARPEKILCITYTKAASAEMQQRIEAQLGGWAIAEEEALRDSLAELMGKAPDAKTLLRARQLFARVLDTPERIRIQTIHGFCQSVLMRFPLEAGIAPHFTLIDEHTSRELLAEAREKLFTQSQGRADCAAAIEALATLMSETALNALIKNIINERRKFSTWFEDAEGAARLKAAIYRTVGIEEGATADSLTREHFVYAPEDEQKLRQAAAALEQCAGDSDKRTCAALKVWLETREDHSAYARAFVTLKHEARKAIYTKSAEKHLPAIGEILFAEQRRVLAFYHQLQSLKVAEVSAHLMVIAEALLALYSDEKARRSYMDYDDLILYTVQLFKRAGAAAWVLYKLDGGIDHLLVDEAQDTSPEQWQLVEVLADEFFAGEGARNKRRSVFVVGDEKQSIFSFQGAEPLAFDAVQQRLSKRAEAAEIIFKRVRLALSFRSSAPVLKAVDEVFRQPAARDGLIFSEADISHEVNRVGAAGRVEFWPLQEMVEPEQLPPWHIPEQSGYAPRPEILCAKQIADTIAGWLKEKRVLPSQGRPVCPGDIMILVQRRGAFADAMLRALKQKDVAVAGADRLVLTEHIAIMDCIVLAEFLLLPQDDLTLATVLKSPFIGVSEEDLFTLAYGRGKESLWQRLRANPKFANEAEFLSDLLARTDYLPPYELFAYALETRGGRRKLAARLGAEIDDPLNEFLALALQYDGVHSPSLQGFLHWLREGATEIKRDMEKGRDEVRIMTVHGAKGLQAPIVFLPDTTRMPRYDASVLWTADKERVPLFSPAGDHDDQHYRALRDLRRAEVDREYRRLLYVAMTRAEDEIYICGWKGSRPLSSNCWYELIKTVTETWEQEGDKKVLSSPQTAPVKKSTAPLQQSMDEALPGWVHAPPLSEPTPPKPLTPSRMETAATAFSPVRDASRRQRGLLIHRLLQYLPEAAPDDRPRIMEQFIARYGEGLTPQEKEVLEREVFVILQHPDFAPVFGPGSVAEAPISGKAEDNKGNPVVISGQIDRLAVVENEVYIIDYKTNRDVPGSVAEIPRAYIRQMEAYRQLVARIYPGHSIHCALLWTAGPKLMILNEDRFPLSLQGEGSEAWREAP